MPKKRKEIKLTELSDEQLVDHYGRVKANQADWKFYCEKARTELLRRHGKRIKRRKNGLALEGKLFRVVICWVTTKWVLDIDRVRAYLGKKVKDFEVESPYFLVTLGGKTGQGREVGGADQSARSKAA